jgi:hypothetical protein
MTDDDTPPPGTTHVIEWLPPEVFGQPRYPEGLWDLRPLADFTGDQWPTDDSWSYTAGMTASAAELAAWASRLLGTPCRLTLAEREIAVVGFPVSLPFRMGSKLTRLADRCRYGRWIPQRLYWVAAAGI